MKTDLENAMQTLISAGWAESQHGDLFEDTHHYALVPIDGANRDQDATPFHYIFPIHDPAEQRMRSDQFHAQEKLADGHYLVIEDDQGHVSVGGPLTVFQVVQWRRAHDEGTLDDLLEDGAFIRAIPAIF